MKIFLFRITKFVGILIIASHVFVWYYEIPQRDAYQSETSVKLTKWNSIKEEPNKYDVIILGSSRGYSAYNPMVIDSIANMDSYNMCTGSQHIIESLYMFKEILKSQKPKYLIYEVCITSYRRSPDFFHIFSNAKFMSNEMVLNEFIAPRFLNLLFPIVKYKSYLKKNVRDLYKSNNTTSNDSISWIKGHKASNIVIDSSAVNRYGSIFTFSDTDVLPTNEIEYYLKALKKLCDDNGIELLCIRAPYPPTRLKNTLTDNANPYFTKFFSSQEIKFYDLNYNATKDYSDYDFEDYAHMNSFGAAKASVDLAEILNAQKSRP
jgi:hypothetical protein